MKLTKTLFSALVLAAFAFAAEEAKPVPATADTVKTEAVKEATVEAPKADSVAQAASADTAKADTLAAAPADSAATAPTDSVKADTSEVLEAKAASADTAKADTLAAAPADSAATAAPTDSAKVEDSSTPRTAGQTIMENPLEFIIVSAAFIASVLVIIFTGKD